MSDDQGQEGSSTAAKQAPARLKCSFCGKTQDQVAKVIAGPSVYICNLCVDVSNRVLESACVFVEPKPVKSTDASASQPDNHDNAKLKVLQTEAQCSFCSKSKAQVDGFVGDGQVCICNECVGLCNEILDEELFERPPGAKVRLDKRADVLETVVRQAMFGTRWYTLCADLMRQQAITVEDVKQEVARQLATRSSDLVDVIVDGNMRPDQKSLLVLAKIYSRIEEIDDRLGRLEKKDLAE